MPLRVHTSPAESSGIAPIMAFVRGVGKMTLATVADVLLARTEPEPEPEPPFQRISESPFSESSYSVGNVVDKSNKDVHVTITNPCVILKGLDRFFQCIDIL